MRSISTQIPRHPEQDASDIAISPVIPNSARKFVAQWRRHPSLEAIATNSAWLVFDKVGRALIALLVGAWVARHLGPTDYGTLAFVIAFIALSLPIASLSADQIVVRNLAKADSSREALLGSALIMRLALGTACWALAVAAIALLYSDDRNLILMTAIIGGTLVFQAADVIDLWFQSQSQSRRTVLAKLVAFLASSGIKIALILSGASVTAFAVVTALESMLAAVAMIVAYARFRTGHGWRPTRDTSSDLLRQAAPFMLTGLAIVVYMRVDQILIKQMLGAHELGIYAAVIPLSYFWQMLPMAIATSVAPFVARQRQLDRDLYQRQIVILMRALFYLGLTTTVLTFAISGWLVPLLLGDAYASAVVALNVHAISNIFAFIGVGASLWVTNESRATSLFHATIAGALIGAILNLTLLPRIGIIGASISAIGAQAIAAMFLHALLNPELFRLQLAAITFRTR